MSDQYVLDNQGQPHEEPDLIRWAEWLEHAGDARRVAHDLWIDATGQEILVSTVFLGLDHAFGCGPPVLWETMIFGGPHDQHQDRYTSREAAVAGHATALALAKGGDAT